MLINIQYSTGFMFEDQLLEIIAEMLGDPESKLVIEYCESLTEDQLKLISSVCDDIIAMDLQRSEELRAVREILRRV